MKLGVAIVAPLLFFAMLEGGLRLAGVGRSTDFFIPDEAPGVYRTNPRYTELFFPASFGLKPLNFRLAKEKPAGTLRVFVVGESAAMGVPEPGFSIAPQLRALLRAAHPDAGIEVCNLGVTAINSHAIRHLVRQAVEFRPDLMVVYLGNNEVVGPFGPGSTVGERMLPLPLVRASLWVRTTRTGQLVQRVVARAAGARRPFKDWRGMEMFAGRSVAADDPRLEAVYANFAENLADILTVARDAGIRTILSTVAVNVRDCAPFASEHGRTLAQRDRSAWQEAFDRATTASALGDTVGARTGFEEALRLDPCFAEAHFVYARFLETQGEHETARRHYLDALQWDGLRFRADERINELIRHAAAANPGTVSLVDAARELGSDRSSTVAPAGGNLFFEHVHLTWDGNHALARLIAPAAAASLFGRRPSDSEWLSAAACARAVGFTEIGRLMMLASMEELTGRPPFIGQRTFAEDRARLRMQIGLANEQLSAPGALTAAVSTIEAARTADPGNAFLTFHAAAARLQTGDLARALALNETLTALQPPSPEQASQRAYLLQELGRASEAEEVLIESARSDPYYFQTYALLGRLWLTTGQAAKAREYFEGLVERMPESRAALHSHAQALASSGEWPAAERQWRAVLRITPDDEAALAPLVARLVERHETEAALELMLAAHAYNPRSLENNARLVQFYAERDDVPQLVKYMRALTESGPVTAALHFDLAVNLARLGRGTESRIQFLRARRAAAEQGDAALVREIDTLIESP